MKETIDNSIIQRNIALWSKNTSNCITEIPQDIKLEIIDGYFVLKSGSKLTTGDGTQYTTNEDFTINAGSPHGKRLLLITRNTTSGILGIQVGVNGTNIFSGDTAPTVYVPTAYWYDTTNKVIKRTQDTGSTWSTIDGNDICLPIASVTFSLGNAVSIDTVFNGFGYIGSTVFVLPGVKALIPNGRNKDGTLNNIQTRTTQLSILNNTGNKDLFWGIDGNNIYSQTTTDLEYDKNTNTTNWKKAIIASGTVKVSSVELFFPKKVFHALDWNDSSTIAGFSAPSKKWIRLDLAASGATYTAPANGWFHAIYHTTASSGTNSSLNLKNETTGISDISTEYSTHAQVISALLQVRRGEIVSLSYEGLDEEVTTDWFKFYYAEGENV